MLFLFLFLFLTTLAGAMLFAIGKMIREKDDTGVLPESPLKGGNIELVPITFRCNRQKFEKLLSTMPDKSVQLLEQWFRFDYLFMFCIYPFLFFLQQWLRHYSLSFKSTPWLSFIDFFGWLVLVIWILDVLENKFAIAAINDSKENDPETPAGENASAANVGLMRVTSVLKWVGILIYALPALFMLLNEIYLRIR